MINNPSFARSNNLDKKYLKNKICGTDKFDEDLFNTKFIDSLLKGTRNIFILWLISKKEKIHGYGLVSLMNEVIYNEAEKKIVYTSTIYPVLHSLEDDHLIKSSQGLNGKHKVKMYEITDEGRQMLCSLKLFINNKSKNNVLYDFFDDMIFNEDMFIKNGGE